MFGTMGFSELIIILVIVLIIFGAGRLPQIGEGVGKALKGFKKEVNDIPPPVDPSTESPEAAAPAVDPNIQAQTPPAGPPSPTPQAPQSNQPYQPGPELTPGTTAALLYKGAGPEAVQPKGAPQAQSAASHVPPPVTMEQRATAPPTMSAPQYPPLPASAQAKPMAKRPSAIVNKKAVARVQAQQAALKAKAKPAVAPAPQDMQTLGEGLGSAIRTFRDAASDIKNSIDPEMRTIQAELEAAEKEMQETIETAKQPVLPKEPPSTT
ncbi:MAG: twin-arginine translocase TatA/TatE family subunit [Nitrospira sp.]|nr:twin-arginine translocase TatA/TatE family subunit [Nitrospira sp.]